MPINTDLETILSSIEGLPEFSSLMSSLQNKRTVHAAGLTGSMEALTILLINRITKKPVVAVLPDDDEAEFLADELNAMCNSDNPDTAFFFPGTHEYKDSPLVLNPRQTGEQNRALAAVNSGSFSFFVCSHTGMMQRVPEPARFSERVVFIEKGKTVSPMSIVERLVEFGYTREICTERPGEVSLRGGILDVFPFSGSRPCRIEFLGDTVDSLRMYNPVTQRSTGPAESITVVPTIDTWKGDLTDLTAYFPEGVIAYVRDRDRVRAQADKVWKLYAESFTDPHHVIDTISCNPLVLVSSLAGPEADITFRSRYVSIPEKAPSPIRKALQDMAQSQRIVLSCKDRREKEHLKEYLNLVDDPLPGVRVSVTPIHTGFALPGAGLAVLTGQDVFGRKRKRSIQDRYDIGVPVRDLSSLKNGDFVVHIDHGIGKYRRLEKITVDSVEQECLSIEYEGGDKLYVPLESIDRIQKYSGREGAAVKISRLGTGAWERIKARTKESVKKIAKELITLYAERYNSRGFAFSADTAWQRSLEAGFAYEETPEQAGAIRDVKRDMESSSPMDRLICGDVGFGKTEVALRAAFKAVNDSKQVAILVPTTILAQQHFTTFSLRLSPYPVTIGMLSRFKTRREQLEIISGLSSGDVDIVIGTHRLLSKDVSFKDLGLLIIDEEQRFGVKQKEKLRALKKNVDSLSMSATPIPRTLQFSMSGIRDMSLITTPPVDRLPIHTEVAPFSERIIIDAISRELDRGGQIFFVHNRVKSINAVARMINRLVPDARLVVAHGQMDGKSLEKVMYDFSMHKYDVLVSTMIIESGLDMPRVNTLIVHRADQLGLAQLYQIRGRVGRSGKRAYAYLLTPPFHLLSHEAVKRLRTIEEFTELGAGFEIARRDLEIRGAGNFFGIEQSGSMDAVGAELYNKLIQEAVTEVKQETMDVTPEPDEIICSVTSHLSAFLPEQYVPDEGTRLDLYRRLSMARTHKQVKDIRDELTDRFGPLPRQAETMILMAEIRISGQKKGFKRIAVSKEDARLYLDESWPARFDSPELFTEYVRSFYTKSDNPVRFLKGGQFGVRVSAGQHDTFSAVKKLLQS